MMTAMKFHHEVRYDAAPAEVFAMLTDPAFREKSLAATGVLSCDVEATPQGSGATLRVDMVQPTQGMPGFAKKFAGESTRVIQTEDWSGPQGGTIDVGFPGKPVRMTGTITLVADGQATVETWDGEVKVAIPLIGGKLEKLTSDLFVDGANLEHDAGVAWLAGDRS